MYVVYIGNLKRPFETESEGIFQVVSATSFDLEDFY